MKRFWLAASLLVVCAASALAQTTDELVNDGKNPDNVTTQSMGYARQSYSPLKQINATNVKRLVPIWNTSVMNDMGELASPTVYNGVMYVINGKWTFALDVQTGRQITYTHNGRQYVTIASGRGGVLANRYAGAKVPSGGSVWTFALTP